MLRSPNRNLNSLANTKPNNKKQDMMELCTLVDKCSQIYRDDRIALRSLVKDQQDPKLIQLLQKYKKKVGVDDLSDLQIELRKFMNQMKGKKVATSPDGRQFIKSKNVHQKENYVSPPPLDNIQSNYKMSTINTGELHSSANKKKQSFVFLQKPLPLSAISQLTLEQEKQLEVTPAKSTADQLQFMTIISQSPHQMSSLIIDCKDLTEEKCYSNRSFDQEVILKYNVEEINAYRGQEQSEQAIESTACNHCGANASDIRCEDVFPSILPELLSLNYQATASPQFRSLFTDWNKLLSPNQQTSYKFTQKTLLPDLVFEADYSNLPQQSPTSANSPNHFMIYGVSSVEMFDALFLTSTHEQKQMMHIQPNSQTYHQKLNQHQMRQNILSSLPGSDIDVQTLFTMCDNDCDGWASAQEVGNVLQNICDQIDQSPDLANIDRILQGENLTYASLEAFLMEKKFKGLILESDVNDLAKKIFQEIDLHNRGFLTRWDLYHNRGAYQIRKLLSI